MGGGKADIISTLDLDITIATASTNALASLKGTRLHGVMQHQTAIAALLGIYSNDFTITPPPSENDDRFRFFTMPTPVHFNYLIGFEGGKAVYKGWALQTIFSNKGDVYKMSLNTKEGTGWVDKRQSSGDYERLLNCQKNASGSWDAVLPDGYVATASFAIPQ
ncbi:hypothetical protein D3C87_1386290 [compost metagenome]